MIKRQEGSKNNKEIVLLVATWVKRHWPYLAGGAFLILALSVGFLAYALYGNDGDKSQTNTAMAAPTSTEPNDGLVARWLDGIRVPESESRLLPRAVMIENQVHARPLAGIAEASLVFEASVEGGITRLMAVFNASTTAEEIGPVRSARPYYVEWAQSLDAIYAHVGGSPEALNRIGGLTNFRNLDEMAGERYFWRSKYRAAPHNVFTSSENLNKVEADKEWEPGIFTPWIFTDEDKDIPPGNIKDVTIPFDGSYKVKWVYDQESNSYERYLAGSRDKDKKGTPINAKNILVLSTDQKVLDDKGRLYIRTTGEGKGWYFAGAEVKEIVWSRTAGDFYKINTPDGRDVAFLRGNTWIEIASLPKYEPKFKSEE
ncbi:MAG: DUF3048 domain-containing protein [Patescibacteria group bacterium]|nr:DUF3048 domain-containing protein [Patescibacteria group bacterium]